MQVVKAFGRAFAASVILVAAAVPAGAQQYSEGYTFIKAVKDRDATKVTTMVAVPGTTVINAKDQDSGEAALHILTRARDYTWLSFMLGKRANPNIQNRVGDTPLSLAAQIGWSEGADLILAHGANVDLANSRGETPLIMAVHTRDIAMVRLLLSYGANPTKTDHTAGMSALDYARQDNRAVPILRLLESVLTPARPAAGPKL
jgi:hypothetical protein